MKKFGSKLIQNWISSLRVLSVVALVTFTMALGSSACCSDPMQVCLKFSLINNCPACQNGSIIKTNFLAQVGSGRKTSNEFVSSPWSLCFGANQAGGDPIFAVLTRVCVQGTTVTLMTCVSPDNLKTPKDCDHTFRDVDVPLTCTCQ